MFQVLSGNHEQCHRRWVRETEVSDQLKQIQLMYNHLAVNPPQAPFMLTDGNSKSGSLGKVSEPEDDDE